MTLSMHGHAGPLGLAVGLGLALAAIWACAPPPVAVHQPVAPPTSPWGNKFAFSWDPPAGSAAPHELTIAVVAPDFDLKDCALSDRDKTYRNVVKGLAHSLAVDLDRALVAKGVRVSGPFDTFSDMTYAQKQAADFALTPAVCVRSLEVKYTPLRPIGSDDVADYIEKPFDLEMEVDVLYVLKEPMSEEKLWVKKLNLDPAKQHWVEAYQAVPHMAVLPGQSVATQAGFDPGELLYDGKPDAMATLFKGMYPTVMSKAWTYLDTDEMTHMKPTVDEIRKKSTVIQR